MRKETRLTEDDQRALRRIKYFTDKRADELNRALEAKWELRMRESGEAAIDAEIVENLERIFKGHEIFVSRVNYYLKKGDYRGMDTYIKFFKLFEETLWK